MATLAHKDMEALCTCPILQQIMIDPVNTIEGQTYERSAIEEWFRTNK